MRASNCWIAIASLVLSSCGDDESPELTRIRRDGFSCTWTERVPPARFEIPANQHGPNLEAFAHGTVATSHLWCSDQDTVNAGILICTYDGQPDLSLGHVEVVKTNKGVAAVWQYTPPGISMHDACMPASTP